MNVEVLNREESFGLMARSHLARIACSKGERPYIVPINYVLDGEYLYSFSTFGQKIEWMRANPNVCIEIDDIAHSRNWESVIATGTYEELTDDPKLEDAASLLQRRPNWWQPGFVRTVISGVERPLVPIFFRIRLHEVTGHRLNTPLSHHKKEGGGIGGFVKSLFGESDFVVTGKHGTRAH